MSDSFVTPWTVICQASSVHVISQEKILECVAVAISFSRGFFWPRDWTQVSDIGRQILYHWATWEAKVENCNQQLSSESTAAAQAWSPFLSELTLSWHLLEDHWPWPLIQLAHLYLFHHTQRVFFFWKSLVKLFCLAWALRDLLFSC